MTSTLRGILVALAAMSSLAANISWAATPEDPPPVWRQRPRMTDRGNSFQEYPTAAGPRNRRPSEPTRQASMQTPAEEVSSPQAHYPAPTPDPAFGGDDSYGSSFEGSSFEGGEYGDDGCCGDSCGFGGPPCRGPIYARGEYLLWWLKGDNTPPLVTTSPPGTSREDAGVLGLDTTSVLFGDGALNGQARSGGRVVIGVWLDPCARFEGEWFGLGDQSSSFTQTSDANTILARPFFNLTTGAQDSNVVSFPGQLQGSLSAVATSSFQGAGLHATENLVAADYCCECQHRVDFVYGFRYLRLNESLTVDDTITAIGTATPVPVGTSITTSDSFTTTNNFYGANFGLMTENRGGRWCFTGAGRFAIGGTDEKVVIAGNTTARIRNQTTTSQGGLLALPTNIGSYNHGGFTVVPQLELKLAYDLTCNLRITVGYDAIYWSRVARPGEQIDTFINTSQASGQPLVGTPGPRFVFRESDLWIQGLSVGGELRF